MRDETRLLPGEAETRVNRSKESGGGMRCFVIGPIGDQLGEPGSAGRTAYEEAVQVFEEVIQAACAPFHIDAYRADDINDPGEIPEQIFTALRDEELVIADLTGANPNVMYELGIRHVTGKCTLQIGEKSRLPFDVNTIRTVQFKRTPSGLVTARRKLQEHIGQSLANGCKPSAAARIMGQSVGADFDSGPGVQPEGPDDEPDIEDEATEEPMGLLDALAELEISLPELDGRTRSMTALTKQIADLTTKYTPRVQNATKPAQRLGIAAQYARELQPMAYEFDQESVEFSSRVTVLSLAVDTLIDHIESNEPGQEGAAEMLDGITTLATASKEARVPTATYRDSVAGLEGISRELRPVVRLLRGALDRTIDGFDRVAAWGARAAHAENRA